MTNRTNNYIHTRFVPFGYAFIWGVGLLLSLVGLSFLSNKSHSDKFVYLFSAYCVFLIFLGEVVLSFIDIASIHDTHRIKGTVFWVFSRFFGIIILTLITSFFFYESNCIYLLAFLGCTMCWLKWEIANLNNNMDKYVIKEEGYNIIANNI